VNDSRVERSSENLRSKKEAETPNGNLYSDYSVWRRFEAICVFAVVSVVRMHRNGRVSSLFSIERRFPSQLTGTVQSGKPATDDYDVPHETAPL